MRLSVVVPIGVIVAVAIVCVVVAVLSSAKRADEVALDAERQLFTRAITTQGDRILREIESVATSDAATQRIRKSFDHDWVQIYVGGRLQTFFEHDFVFVTDANDQLLFASLGRRSVDPGWFNSIHNDFKSVLNVIRGRSAGERDAVALAAQSRAMRMQQFLGRPAIVAAVAVATPAEAAAPQSHTGPPVIISVKFIDDDVLADIASRLQLQNLRALGDEPPAADARVLDLTGPNGVKVARFAWTPKQPGTDIVHSVLPFITIALAGFTLLAGLVLRHMRRTAATIAAGETRLRHLALHDPLCGLPNRIFFGERLKEMIEKVRAGGPSGAVFYIDLDHFKDVNDTLGHPVGDELILSVTQRLARTVRSDDLVARLGGDEFAVISASGFESATLQAIASRMIATICAPYSIANQTIVIGASIGIAVIDENVGGAPDVMRHADLALYRAKNEGRNRAVVYDSAMDADLLKRKVLENDLRRAIQHEELWVAYQPIVSNSGEVVVGVEALCRWKHPERGEISPAEFIPVAEHSGLIIALGEWVLRRACLDGKAWPGLAVSVNVSPLQFRRADFVDVVERILAETEFDPSRLELEVTESTLLGNVETAELAMFRLKALGVRLALDDFGTGYSSLLYLRRFPFDKLKVDSSFVRSIERAADAAAIVHAVVSLGRGLGMKVTAEGVETAEQHLFLRAAGVHSMQGYRFGRPSPAAVIDARLAEPGSFRIADDDKGLAMAG
ncbi:MAG: EAL domain-containing protein [Hyphomicrobiales bacterium]|nr:EAL domain-containing protein [Hyphomicrobiales bacterium]